MVRAVRQLVDERPHYTNVTRHALTDPTLPSVQLLCSILMYHKTLAHRRGGLYAQNASNVQWIALASVRHARE